MKLIIEYKWKYYECKETSISSKKEISFNLSAIHNDYFWSGILSWVFFVVPVIFFIIHLFINIF